MQFDARVWQFEHRVFLVCGLVGFLGGRWQEDPRNAEQLLRRMSGRIHHRGPDRNAVWLDRENRIGLGHARLSIIDLSAAGDQPMASQDGRYVIVYNGEIYNHIELRQQLEEEGFRFGWRGHSDTETLLAAIQVWGTAQALARTNGMFAFALWDKRERKLSLARDRLGEKPLYYGWQGEGPDRTFLFGSELKGLVDHPTFTRQINRGALTLYLRHGYIPAPYSIYEGIEKLAPGCLVTVDASAQKPLHDRYWSGAEVARAGVANPFSGSAEEAVDRLDTLLMDAVGGQMMADVPLGAFLSGGIDSSTVVALMQAQSSRPVKTFSIGFHEDLYNEAEHAKAVAKHLGTDHTELYVTPEQAMAVIPRLPAMYDEPFADSSQIPTFLVSEMARHHVKVSLSGDGGDELFGGYNRYKFTEQFWRRMSKVPRPLRIAASKGLTRLSPTTWNAVARATSSFLPPSARMALPGDKIHKGAGVLASRSAAELYHGLVSSWRDPAALVIGGSEPPTMLSGNMPPLNGLSDIERMMALDMLTYMPDDILVKVDRAAMSVSLETRVPFLDHRVIEFAWQLPLNYKLREGQTKWALRQVLYRYVPREILERPKMGFGVPIDAWLRGPLKDWAENLLGESRLRREGYFNPEPIRRMWAAHQKGQVNMQYQLWIILMFQAWLEEQPIGMNGVGEGETISLMSASA